MKFKVGDRVRLTQYITMHKPGTTGVIEDIRVPLAHTQPFEYFVRFDGDSHLTVFVYPSMALELMEEAHV